MSEYLTKFRSNLSTVQNAQIARLLQARRSVGQITTTDEFREQLLALTSKLASSTLVPITQVFSPRPGDWLDSKLLNFVLSRVLDDLEAGSMELDDIEQLLDGHDNLIQDVALRAIYLATNELEASLDLHSLLLTDKSGWTGFQKNTWNQGSRLSTSRTITNLSTLFVDSRTLLPMSTNVEIDPVGERILLASNSEYLKVVRAELLHDGSTNSGSLPTTSTSSNDIHRIIDGKQNTFWIKPYLSDSVLSDGVTIKLALDLAGVRDVNFLEIEPASPKPMKLVDVEYVDQVNSIQDAPSFTAQTISTDTVGIELGSITTKRLILTFTQENYSEISTARLADSNRWNLFLSALTGKSVDPSAQLDLLDRERVQQFASDWDTFVSSLVTDNSSRDTVYEYVLGFDNIRVGKSKYSTSGIFVGQQINTNPLLQAGLYTKEIRPYLDSVDNVVKYTSSTYTGSNQFLASIEYWLHKHDVDTRGGNYITRLPILPIGTTTIKHERLLLTRKSNSTKKIADQGFLIFFPKSSPVPIIYRNGDLLTSGYELEEVVPGANSSSPMVARVTITGEVKSTDIYTVSYSPKLSNTTVLPVLTNDDEQGSLLTVDLVGNRSAWMIESNKIAFAGSVGSNELASSRLSLVTILRRNTSLEGYTSIVEEYSFLYGSLSDNGSHMRQSASNKQVFTVLEANYPELV